MENRIIFSDAEKRILITEGSYDYKPDGCWDIIIHNNKQIKPGIVSEGKPIETPKLTPQHLILRTNFKGLKSGLVFSYDNNRKGYISFDEENDRFFFVIYSEIKGYYLFTEALKDNWLECVEDTFFEEHYQDLPMRGDIVYVRNYHPSYNERPLTIKYVYKGLYDFFYCKFEEAAQRGQNFSVENIVFYIKKNGNFCERISIITADDEFVESMTCKLYYLDDNKVIETDYKGVVINKYDIKKVYYYKANIPYMVLHCNNYYLTESGTLIYVLKLFTGKRYEVVEFTNDGKHVINNGRYIVKPLMSYGIYRRLGAAGLSDFFIKK